MSNRNAFVVIVLFQTIWISAGAGQTLKDLGAQRNLVVGAAVQPQFLADGRFAETLRREFSQIGTENHLKFAWLRPTRDAWDFGPADSMVSFAAHNGLRVRGHVLVWHNRVSPWVAEGATPAKVAEILREHILTVAGRYRNKIYAWDLVSEAHNDDGTLRSSIWYDTPGIGRAGTGYIEQAFLWAREADPNAVLFYADYGAEALNRKSDAIYRMAQDFRSRGVPIGGIAMQCHFTTSFQEFASMEQNIRRITELGLQVHISELDVRVPVDSAGRASAADLEIQARIYREVAAMCTRNPLCTSIQTWGITDARSWIPTSFPGFGAALPFTAAYEPKPSYLALREALAAAPTVERAVPPPVFAPPAIEPPGLGSAASYNSGGVAPGEIVVLYFGASPAPALTVGAPGTDGRYPAWIAETQLLFDGVPARLLYAAPDKVAGFVPFSLADRETTRVEFVYQGIVSNAIVLPVVRAKPGIFTIDQSGTGTAAALHPDYTPVSVGKRVPKGGIVLLFLTGAGATDPPGVDGQVIGAGPLPAPRQPVTATVGSQPAAVLYAGGAVGLPHGGMQVNLRISPETASGNQSVVIRVGEVSSGPQVTIPVE